MLEYDVTQTELATKLGITQSNLANKLKRDNFSEKDLIAIAKVFNIKYEGFFFLDNDKTI